MWKRRIIKALKWMVSILVVLFFLISLLLYLYKDDICNAVIGEVNKHMKAKVEVSNVDLAFWGSFPNLSVDFDHVFIQDSYESSTELDTLLYSEKIRFKFNPMNLWQENYTVESIEINKGTFKMKVSEDGLINYDILKEQTDSTKSEAFDLNLESVDFTSFTYSYINHKTNQTYSTLINEMRLEGELSAKVFTTKASADLQIIEAKSGEVTLVSNQPAQLTISVQVNTDSSTVSIPGSIIYISELPFNFSGEVVKGDFDFNLNAKNLNIRDVANKLSVNGTGAVKKFEGQGVLLFDLNIKSPEKRNYPVLIDCSFGLKSGNLRIPSSKISLNKIKLEGNYSNLKGPKNERLILKNISFHTKGGPFRGNLTLTKFNNPVFDGNADGLLDLSVIHALFSIPNVDNLSGTVNVHSNFLVQGKPKGAGTFNFVIDKCEGTVKLNGINAQMIDDKRVFSSVNGKVYLRNNEAGFDNVSIKIGTSDFEINGVFKEIVDYFSGKGNLNANLEIRSNRINMQDLGSDTKQAKIKRERAFIIPANINGKVYLDVKALNYEEHLFESIRGNMTIIGRTINFPRVSLVNGGADVLGSLRIEETSPEIFYVTSHLVSKNINFTKLFREWDDFKQEVITSDNIEGVAQANVSFEAPFDLRSGIISNAIRSTIDLQIDNGRLKNVQAFNEIISSLSDTRMKSVLGKENITLFSRKLSDLRFDQLKNTIIIQRGVLTIPNMSINSNALSLEVSGKHTFENVIDYRFGFRFRDLKKKQESEFGEIIDDDSGLRVYLRMYGELDSPTIEWDKESRKEQAKENRAEEKKNAKSILKSEFGLFKNDTTVKQYIKEVVPKEELIIEFDPLKSIDTIIENKEPKRDTKMTRWLEKMKQQAKKEKEENEDFIIE